MSTNQPKKPTPPGVSFRKRFWHWRLQKYLYASDYGLKAWPINKK